MSIEMFIISGMGVINISRQHFNTFVGMGSRSHDFDDELKVSFLISSFVARSKEFILNLISGFCTDIILGPMYLIWEFGADYNCNFIHKMFRKMYGVDM